METTDHLVRVYNNSHEWYRSADTKAHIVLATATIFFSILGSGLLTEPDKLEMVLANFGIDTYIFLILVFIGMSGSVFAALMCLRSRLPSGSSRPSIGESTLFFDHIAKMSLCEFETRIHKLSPDDQDRALVSQIWRLSRNVRDKHHWANRGFLLLVVGLAAFMLLCISYGARTAFG